MQVNGDHQVKDILHRLSTVWEQEGKLQTPVTFCELRQKGQPTTTGTRNTVTTLWKYNWGINPRERQNSLNWIYIFLMYQKRRRKSFVIEQYLLLLLCLKALPLGLSIPVKVVKTL